jgi:exopolysaccharide biosynthesis polyprenyl glycosylphosphotransferase
MGMALMTDTLGMVLDVPQDLVLEDISFDDLELDDLALEELLGQRTVPQRATRSALPPLSFPWWVRALDHAHGCRRTFVAPLADGVALALAAVLAGLPLMAATLLGIAMLGAFVLAGVYDDRSPLETQGVLWYPPTIATPFVIVSLAFLAAAEPLGASQAETLRFAAAAGTLLVVGRGVAWGLLSTCRRKGIGQRRAVVVGSGALARTVVDKLHAYPEAGLYPVGILAPDGRREGGMGIGIGALPADLPAVVRGHHVEHVILVPEGNHDVGVAESLELCDGLTVTLSMLPALSDLFLDPSMVTQVGGLPLISMGKVVRTREATPGKRILDVAAAGLLLLLAFPLMAATAIAIKLDDRGPLFFRQSRVGQGGKLFSVLKFRTMVVGADRMVDEMAELNITDGLLFKVRNDPRVTRVGRLLRRLSLDELPQLWNVLKGEMSMVGPRPLPVEPDDFGALDGKRHSVPPGITGYWQIAGGTGLTYQEMVKLDLAYIQNWSLWLDLRILARTVPALFTRHHHGSV